MGKSCQPVLDLILSIVHSTVHAGINRIKLVKLNMILFPNLEEKHNQDAAVLSLFILGCTTYVTRKLYSAESLMTVQSHL